MKDDKEKNRKNMDVVDRSDLGPPLRALLRKREDERHAAQFIEACKETGKVQYIETDEMVGEELLFFLGSKYCDPFMLLNKESLPEMTATFKKLGLKMVNKRLDSEDH